MIKYILLIAVILIISPYIWNYIKFNILYNIKQKNNRWIIECPSCKKLTNYSHKQIMDIDWNYCDKEFKCSCCGYVIASKNDKYDQRLKKIQIK
jgi:hypothetical protein